MQRIRLLVLTLCAWVAVGTIALAVDFQRSELTVRTRSGQSYPFHIELAETPDQHAQGLMYRTQLAPDAGMLFNFYREQPISMWMKNTLIPLDMIFIRQDGTIHSIAERTIPNSLAIISSRGPVLAVLEVAGGTVSRLHLQPGDRIEYPIFQR